MQHGLLHGELVQVRVEQAGDDGRHAVVSSKIGAAAVEAGGS